MSKSRRKLLIISQRVASGCKLRARRKMSRDNPVPNRRPKPPPHPGGAVRFNAQRIKIKFDFIKFRITPDVAKACISDSANRSLVVAECFDHLF